MSEEAKDPTPVRDHAWEYLNDDAAQYMEQTLWWVRGRRFIIRRFVDIVAASLPDLRLKSMDIACGAGGNLGVLAEYGPVLGVDSSPILVKRAAALGIAQDVHCVDVRDLPVQRDVTLLTAFDVLEHIADDEAFLRHLAQLAAPHHFLLVSVPACPWLYGDHDRLLHHHRRYSASTLRRVLDASGYDVVCMSPFMTLLFPIAAAARLVDRVRSSFGYQRTNVGLGQVRVGAVNTLLTYVLRAEAIASQKVQFPFGLWLFALARARAS